MRPIRFAVPVISLALSLPVLLISGCGTGLAPEAGVAPIAAPSGPQGLSIIEGSVYGGQQPLHSAQVYVFAASTTGNGGNGIAASASNASTSLVGSTTTPVSGYPIVLDSSGDITNGDYGVTTDANGGYKIPDVPCTTGTQIYLVSIGGYYSSTASNPAAGLMAMLGNCSGTTISSSIGTNTRIVMNEASTIAGAYAVAGFATNAVHIGAYSATNPTLAATGLRNAFANANQLESLTYGSTTARTTTPNGNGTVPVSLLNSLANTLSNCVNSTGSTSGACSASGTGLFHYATATGVAGGTAPTETATAAIYIAQHPAANVSNIFALTTSTVNPFTPFLASAPNDLSVGIVYTGSGLTASTVIVPHSIAVDKAGDVYMVSPGSSTSFALFTPLGVATNTTNSSYLLTPYSVSLDISGNAWFTDEGTYDVTEYIPGTGFGTVTGATDWRTPHDLEWDANGMGWITADYNDYVIQFNSTAMTYNVNSGDAVTPNSVALQTGTSGYAFISDAGYAEVVPLTSTDTGTSYDTTTNKTRGIAVDASNRGWATETATYVAVAGTGGTATTEYSIKGSLYNAPVPDGIAADGSSNMWVTDTKNGTVVEVNNSGTILSGSYGYVPVGNVAATTSTVANYAVHPAAVAVDGSGDVWYETLTDNTLRELIGIATPVATPLVYGVVNGKIGQRP